MLLYTANIGEYDQVQVTPQPGFDFYIYQTNIYGLSDVKSARNYKILYPMGYKCSIWLDANIKINCDLKAFVKRWLTKDIDMVVMEHGRDCIYEEGQACIQRKKDHSNTINPQMDYYRKRGLPKHSGMAGTGIIMRRHNMKVCQFMELWFDQVQSHSYRDQLSFNFIQWELHPDDRLKLAHIPYSVFGNEFELIPHEKNNKK